MLLTTRGIGPGRLLPPAGFGPLGEAVPWEPEGVDLVSEIHGLFGFQTEIDGPVPLSLETFGDEIGLESGRDDSIDFEYRADATVELTAAVADSVSIISVMDGDPLAPSGVIPAMMEHAAMITKDSGLTTEIDANEVTP